jgi:hypothetical protein
MQTAACSNAATSGGTAAAADQPQSVIENLYGTDDATFGAPKPQQRLVTPSPECQDAQPTSHGASAYSSTAIGVPPTTTSIPAKHPVLMGNGCEVMETDILPVAAIPLENAHDAAQASKLQQALKESVLDAIYPLSTYRTNAVEADLLHQPTTLSQAPGVAQADPEPQTLSVRGQPPPGASTDDEVSQVMLTQVLNLTSTHHESIWLRTSITMQSVSNVQIFHIHIHT